MKKIILIFLLVLLVANMVACQKQSNAQTNNDEIYVAPKCLVADDLALEGIFLFPNDNSQYSLYTYVKHISANSYDYKNITMSIWYNDKEYKTALSLNNSTYAAFTCDNLPYITEFSILLNNCEKETEYNLNVKLVNNKNLNYSDNAVWGISASSFVFSESSRLLGFSFDNSCDDINSIQHEFIDYFIFHYDFATVHADIILYDKNGNVITPEGIGGLLGINPMKGIKENHMVFRLPLEDEVTKIEVNQISINTSIEHQDQVDKCIKLAKQSFNDAELVFENNKFIVKFSTPIVINIK